MIEIKLDLCECKIASTVGLWRAKRVIEKKLKAGHGVGERNKEQIKKHHMLGARAELAFAKHMDAYWGGGSENWQSADVAGYEVRGTDTINGHAIVFDKDDNSALVVLVIVSPASELTGRLCRIIGTITAQEAKKDHYLKPPEQLMKGSQKQYWVPQSDLKPFGEE